MSQNVMLRCLFAGIYSLVFAWLAFSRYDTEIGSDGCDEEGMKYRPYLSGYLLPMILLVLVCVSVVNSGIKRGLMMMFSLCFGIFLQICIYYLILILLLPLMRRFISARACAMLWLIPNYLYITFQSYMELSAPWFVITVSDRWAWVLLSVWLAGFFAVLLWKCAEHLYFRHKVLENAFPAADPEILCVWEQTIADACMKKPKFRLMISPWVTSPISIGLFSRSIRVVLPQRSYSREELELILRHEIIHIGREDAWSKFFLVFCTAICWFNPLMWAAMRRSAEDLELSCDETVLLGSDQDTRKKYAALLLDTSGDERGFTTCLSASAHAMRYRLKSIICQTKRRSGGLIVGAVFFILCMTSGYVTLAYGGNSGGDLIFSSAEASQYTLRSVSLAEDDFHTIFGIHDPPAFNRYLSRLTLYQITGNYSFSEEKRMVCLMDAPEGTLSIVLSDHIIKLVPLYGESSGTEKYYVAEGIDWDYLSTIIVEYPALNVQLNTENNYNGKSITASLQLLRVSDNDRQTILYESGTPDEVTSGIFGSTRWNDAVLSFSRELSAPCSVRIETWDRSGSYTLEQTDMTQPFAFELPEYPAHYTVCASFGNGDGTVYEAEFRFEVGDVDSMDGM